MRNGKLWLLAGAVLALLILIAVLSTCNAQAGGGEEQVQQQGLPEGMVPEEHPHVPEAPTVIVVDGGSSIGEWAALIAAGSSMVVALGGAEVFRRRRKRKRSPSKNKHEP